MKDLRNFTEIFRKCEADHNINIYKKRVSPSLENIFLEKPQGKNHPLLTLLAFLGLGK